jgi:hypothetical protein
MILAWAGLFPVMYVIGFLAARIFKVPALFSVAIAASALFILSAFAEVTYFRCPRCGQSFAATWWYRLGPLVRKGAHCGLRRYSDGEAAQ